MKGVLSRVSNGIPFIPVYRYTVHTGIPLYHSYRYTIKKRPALPITYKKEQNGIPKKKSIPKILMVYIFIPLETLGFIIKHDVIKTLTFNENKCGGGVSLQLYCLNRSLKNVDSDSP